MVTGEIAVMFFFKDVYYYGIYKTYLFFMKEVYTNDIKITTLELTFITEKSASNINMRTLSPYQLVILEPCI